MSIRLQDKAFRHIANPNVVMSNELSQSALESGACELARREIETWPEYQPTPLIALNNLAKSAGVGQIWYKGRGAKIWLEKLQGAGRRVCGFPNFAE